MKKIALEDAVKKKKEAVEEFEKAEQRRKLPRESRKLPRELRQGQGGKEFKYEKKLAIEKVDKTT